MTAYGMLISTFTRTQIAALFGTAILTVLPATQFAGMMTPVSSLAGEAQIIGRGFPMTYFVPISVGTFTKGLGFLDLRTSVTTSESACAWAPCGDVTRGGGIPGTARQQYVGRHDRHASDSEKMVVRRLEAR
jgi:hypothetical protein